MTAATILLVDDDRDVVEVTCRVLERFGYRCVTASDNETALGLVRTTEPDLLITDLYHHGADGLDLCRAVRRRRPDLPMILFTGCVLTGYEAEDIPDGVDYLLKPATMGELLRRVEEALGISAVGEDAV